MLAVLFRFPPNAMKWYLIAVAVPALTVGIAIALSRTLHQAAPFLPVAALPVIAGLQLATGAIGEELGWRGMVLLELQRKLTPRASAVAMGGLWALWHVPAFFFPGMPQQLLPPAAFLLTVFSFGIFLALLFYKTRAHVVTTMVAHFTFNLGLAIGGAVFGAVLWWLLLAGLSMVAVACLIVINRA